MTAHTAQHVVIAGTGQMGLVVADALCARGISVSMWGPRSETVDRLAADRCMPDRLEGLTLDSDVVITTDPAEACADATVLLNAIPTQYIRGVWDQLMPVTPPGTPIISTSKGIENDTLLRPTEILVELARQAHGVAPSSAVLSGPTIAAELARRLPAALIAASDDSEFAELVQDLFNVPWIRTYTLADPVGVELAGATKNVIALAVGMADGLALGDNAKSMLLARGLAEISRLGTSVGARLETFFGIAGVGDLATTCFRPHGRNRTCGEAIGRGESLATFTSRVNIVVEGVATTRSVLQMASEHGVDMPITQAVGGILFDGRTPKEAIHALMDRSLRRESLGGSRGE